MTQICSLVAYLTKLSWHLTLLAYYMSTQTLTQSLWEYPLLNWLSLKECSAKSLHCRSSWGMCPPDLVLCVKETMWSQVHLRQESSLPLSLKVLKACFCHHFKVCWPQSPLYRWMVLMRANCLSKLGSMTLKELSLLMSLDEKISFHRAALCLKHFLGSCSASMPHTMIMSDSYGLTVCKSWKSMSS